MVLLFLILFICFFLYRVTFLPSVLRSHSLTHSFLTRLPFIHFLQHIYHYHFANHLILFTYYSFSFSHYLSSYPQCLSLYFSPHSNLLHFPISIFFRTPHSLFQFCSSSLNLLSFCSPSFSPSLILPTVFSLPSFLPLVLRFLWFFFS